MSPVETIEARLRDAGAKGGRGLWTCPAHEDRSPSLSVREGRDGRALVRCFAGCDTADVLAALNLRWADLFAGERPTDWTPHARQAPRPIRGRIGLPTVDDQFWSQPDEVIDRHFARLLAEESS